MKSTHLTRWSLLLVITTILFSFYCCSGGQKETEKLVYPNKIIKIDPSKAAELAEKIKQEVAIKIAEGLELSLWASDSLVTDPIAISMDDRGGIYYTNAVRFRKLRI